MLTTRLSSELFAFSLHLLVSHEKTKSDVRNPVSLNEDYLIIQECLKFSFKFALMLVVSNVADELSKFPVLAIADTENDMSSVSPCSLQCSK